MDIGYTGNGKLRRTLARRSVLACYNMIIPFLMRTPEGQRLHFVSASRHRSSTPMSPSVMAAIHKSRRA